MKSKKAKIYKPTKSAMQSGINKTKKWVLEYDTLKTGINALEFAKKMEDSGAGELLVTSMYRDGTQVVYDIYYTLFCNLPFFFSFTRCIHSILGP